MVTAVFPTLCEVAIVCATASGERDAGQKTHVVTQVFPAGVNIVDFIDDIRDSVNAELDERGEQTLPAADYELLTIGGKRLDPKRTLIELGVANGQSLVLSPANHGEAYVPQYEQLSTGLARLGKKLIAPVTETVAARTALVVLTLAVMVVAAIALRARTFIGETFTESMIPTSVLAGTGILLVAMAVATASWWPDQHAVIDTLAWQSCGVLALAGYTFAPGHLGAAHLVPAGLIAVVGVVFTARLTGRHVTAATAVITICVVVGVSVGLRWWKPVPAQVLGVITLTVLLVGIFYVERIALRICGIRPPHFGSVTGRDIFDAIKGAVTLDIVTPVDDTDIDPTPSGEQIGADAVRISNVASGLCIGYAAVLPAAVWAVLAPAGPWTWLSVVVGVLFVTIFITRARAFVAWKQAVPLVLGACVTALAGVVKFVLAAPGASASVLVAGAGAVLVFGLCGLAAAVIVPTTRFMPPIRIAVEWLELVAIVVSVPAMLQLVGLFAWGLNR